MGQDFNRYRAAIEFKGAGASTKTANILMALNIFSLADLRAVPWEPLPHVRGLERRLLASRGCGPVQVALIKNIYDYGHVSGRPYDSARPAEPRQWADLMVQSFR